MTSFIINTFTSINYTPKRLEILVLNHDSVLQTVWGGGGDWVSERVVERGKEKERLQVDKSNTEGVPLSDQALQWDTDPIVQLI